MRREYHRWYSARVGRMMELLVFGHAGAKVLVFPTRDGRFYEYEKLRVVQQHLGEITGEFSSEDLLGSIFNSFCIGK